jgi:general secretion pathway protein K
VTPKNIPLRQYPTSERGIALILVILMIALASALVVALTDSTYVAMRLNSAAERRVKAEYILKSAVNLARVLIKNDSTTHDDPTEDLWMKFTEGAEVPGDYLGISEANVKVQLQITSESGKIPIRRLISATGDRVEDRYRGILMRLFMVLGFDEDSKEVDQTGLFQGRHFKSDELVANLIDYMDTNTENYSAPNFPQGLESDLPTDSPFRNEPIDSLASELSSVPGFTANRVQRLLPLLTTMNSPNININAAPKEVIRALADEIDDKIAQSIVDFRNPANGGPFTAQNKVQELQRLLGSNDASVTGITDIKGSFFEVITKVDYGNSYFMAARLIFFDRNIPAKRFFVKSVILGKTWCSEYRILIILYIALHPFSRIGNYFIKRSNKFRTLV